MTAEKKKELRGLLTLYEDYYNGKVTSETLCQWVDDLVVDACKKQREICADKVNWIDADHPLGVYNSVINAPSPKEKL